jgi:O-antigen/teichoic acid export membrane protein
VARNTFAATLAQVATAVFGYLLLYLTALLAGTDGVGALAVLVSVSLMGQMVAVLGLNTLLTRTIAANRGDDAGELGRSLALATAGGVVVSAVVLAVTRMGGAPDGLGSALDLVALSIAPGAAALVCEGFITGRERLGLVTVSNVIEGFVRLVVAAVALIAGWGVAGLALSLVVTRVLALMIDMRFIRTYLGTSPDLSALAGTLSTLRRALPLCGVFLLLTLFARGDVPILAAISGNAAAGVYAAGNRPVELAGMLPLSLMAALYPALSRGVQAGEPASQRTFEDSLVIAAAAMVAAAAIFALRADLIVGLLYPSSLGAAASVLSVTAWYLVALGVDAVATAVLLASGRFYLALVPLACAALVLVVLNLALDPVMGAVGAALARLAGQVVAGVVNVALIPRGWMTRRLARRLAGVSASGALLVVVLAATHSMAVVGAVLAMAVYGAAVISTGAVARSDIADAFMRLRWTRAR